MAKYLLIFEKNESVRWLGHLDILRTFERAVRRAGLPIAFSGGYNPRERLVFASALSTGVTGGAEPALLELTVSTAPEEIAAGLNAALPPGIRIVDCREIPDAGARDILKTYDRAELHVVCNCPSGTQAAVIERAVETLLAQPQIPITREREGRVKTVDIRPFLYSLALRSGSVANDRAVLEMVLGLGEGGTAKPAEIIAALAEYLPGLSLRRAHRARLLSSNREEAVLQRT